MKRILINRGMQTKQKTKMKIPAQKLTSKNLLCRINRLFPFSYGSRKLVVPVKRARIQMQKRLGIKVYGGQSISAGGIVLHKGVES